MQSILYFDETTDNARGTPKLMVTKNFWPKYWRLETKILRRANNYLNKRRYTVPELGNKIITHRLRKWFGWTNIISLTQRNSMVSKIWLVEPKI